MEYYQLGGFNAAIYSSYGRDLGRKVYEPLRRYLRSREESVELVLGIKRCGTSHILLTEGQKRELSRLREIQCRELRSPAGDFESLSPIVFRDVRELDAKLDSLQPKPRSNRDTSSLNKAYTDGGNHGVGLGQFENIRVFYKVLQNQIIDKRKLDLGDTSWTRSIRVFSFCYNLWMLDARSPEDRKRSPRILDLGWCEASTPTLEESEMKMSQHVVFSNNQLLTNPDKKRKLADTKDDAPAQRARYEYSDLGETQICDAQAAAEKVRDCFRNFAQSTRNPIVLLVHNKGDPKDVLTPAGAIDVLTSMGVDMSQWDFGLKSLLREVRTPPRPPPRQAANDPRRLRRSASPGSYDRSRRRESPPPPRQYAPVYVVDVKSMYSTVFGTANQSESVPTIAERLGLFQPKGWCAGNECWMLVEIFRQMAKRGAIDEQKKEWPDFRVQAAAANPEIDDESDYGGSDSD
ncbi:hypothetical protein B0H19DRAFT_1246126 [Mycena capillaripes]|nr:hypothetical protein B0H19DRAFT_1246126 [Mycena capillaripes]